MLSPTLPMKKSSSKSQATPNSPPIRGSMTASRMSWPS